MLTDVEDGGADRPLVGRAVEQRALLDVVIAAASGRSGTILVSGSAGVGKTALVRDLCARAHTSDVLWAGCLPLSSLVVPFLPLISAMRGWVTARDEAAADRAAMGDLLVGPDFEAGPPGVDRWLDGLCRRRPVLLVADDLQWADQSTLDVLMYLIAGPAQRRLAVVGTLRSEEGEASYPLRRWLADVRRMPRVADLIVGPLDRPATGQQLTALLGRPPRESLIDDVFARTRGNAYLTGLLAGGLPADAAAVPADRPRELRDAVSRAWYGLSQPARELTRVIAVAGRAQRADQLAAVLHDPGDVVAMLREAVDGGVLEAGTDGRYWFVHPLLAEVLEEAMLPEERRHWHAAFAAALMPAAESAEAAEHVVALADHLYRAEEAQPAFRWALRAAAAALRAGGAVESTRLLRRALELWPRVPDPGVTRIDLLRRIRTAAEDAGVYREELTAIDELLCMLEQEPLSVAELLVRRMHLRVLAGTEFFAVEPIREALRLTAGAPGSPQHALVTAELAHAELWHGVPTGPARAREAVRLARACGSDRVLTYALVADVMAEIDRPDSALQDGLAAGQAKAEEARQSAIRARDYFGYVHATVFYANCMGWFAADEVLDYFRRSREEMVRLGAAHAYVAWLSALEANGYLHRGDIGSCRQRLRVALGASPGRHAATETRLIAALLASRQGDRAEAAAHLARAEELCQEQSGFLVSEFDAVRAELAVAAGDAQAAVAYARTGLAQDSTPTLCERLVPLAARALADEILRRRDRAADASAAANQLELLRHDFPHVVAEVYAGRLYPKVVKAMQAWYDAEYARGRGDPGVGQAWLLAADLCRDALLGWDEAYAQWRAAEAYIPGRATRARGMAALRRAYELAVALEAAPLLAQVGALAESARVPLVADPVEEPPAPSLQGLTAREHQIVVLVVAGRTYAEIARALVISEKTVSSHISHILAKTGAANRVELAQLARRRSEGQESGSR